MYDPYFPSTTWQKEKSKVPLFSATCFSATSDGSCFPASALYSEATARPAKMPGPDRSCVSHRRNGHLPSVHGIGSVFQAELLLPLHKVTCGEQRFRARWCAAYLPTSKSRGIAWLNRDNLIARKGTERKERAALHGKYPKQKYARQQGRLSRRAAGAPKGHTLIKTRQNTRKRAARATLNPQLPWLSGLRASESRQLQAKRTQGVSRPHCKQKQNQAEQTLWEPPRNDGGLSGSGEKGSLS